MAVTQQLARLTADELEQCRRSIDVLDTLCSFKLRGPEDHLDLDWAPVELQRAATLAGLPQDLVLALARACDGDSEINEAYRDHPDTVWEHPVAALEPDAVHAVAAQLRRWSAADIVDRVPDDPTLAAQALQVSEMPAAPKAYLATHFKLLRDFYVGASARGLATAMWGD